MSGQFARRLYEARLKRDMTQAELARKAGYTRVSISNIERGVQSPPVNRIKALAKALKVDWVWLASGREV